jgi:hypothetical protein
MFFLSSEKKALQEAQSDTNGTESQRGDEISNDEYNEEDQRDSNLLSRFDSTHSIDYENEIDKLRQENNFNIVRYIN